MNRACESVMACTPVPSTAGLAAPSAGVSALVMARLSDYAVLAKARLSLMVLFVTAVGFCLASPSRIDVPLLFHALFGTALVAAGANVLNQYIERDYDRLMRRTANRPLPAGRVAPLEAMLLGLLCAATGLVHLAWFTNAPATIAAACSIGLYLFAYTPLKRRTIWNTLVGAVPGALPPVIGYAAACGHVDLLGVLLFAIVFFWQMPHFFAIAWMYRDDYARGGYRMISVDDAEGRATGRQTLLYSLLLLLVSVLPSVLGLVEPAALFAAMGLGLPLLGLGAGLARAPSYVSARRMLLASLVYLPAIMAFLLVSRTGG